MRKITEHCPSGLPRKSSGKGTSSPFGHLYPQLSIFQSLAPQNPPDSIETALMKVASIRCVCEAVKSGCASAQVTLNISAPFRIINHQVLLHRLEYTFSVKNVALLCAGEGSYLTDPAF